MGHSYVVCHTELPVGVPDNLPCILIEFMFPDAFNDMFSGIECLYLTANHFA